MNVRYLIIVSLMMLLSSSSFFFSGYFNRLIQQNSLSQDIIDYALTQKEKVAYQINYQQEKLGSDKWLASAYFLANSDGEIAFQLGDYFSAKGQSALAERYWLQATALGHHEARLSLANFYYQRSEFSKAKRQINHFDMISNQTLTIEAKVAMVLGEQSKLPLLISSLSKDSINTDLVAELNSYGIVNKLPSIQQHKNQHTCPLSITLVAGHLDDLRRWQDIAEQYQKSPLAKYVCVDSVKYFPVLSMNCELGVGKAIQCDEMFWQQFSDEITSEYIAIMQPIGGANVHYGILYLDREDTMEIFAHEVAHLLGFIDEYALSEKHQVCQNASMDKSHNVALLSHSMLINDNEISIETVKKLPWSRLISTNDLQANVSNNKTIKLNVPLNEDGIGIFASETCSASNNVLAVKPLKGRTALRNHNVTFPAPYLTLLNENYERYSMPSFHYNIALALYLSGNLKLAKHWLNVSAQYFSLPSTKHKILTGSY